MDTQTRRNLACTSACVLSLLLVGGCGSNTATSPAAPNLTGNWQIQTGSASTNTAPPLGLLLLGALSSQGSNVAGTFRLANLTNPLACGIPDTTVVQLSGSIDSSRNLTLTSAPFDGDSVLTVKLLIPPALNTFATGTIALAGTTCSAPSASAIGVEFPPLSGTFAGTIEPGTPTNPGTTGGGPVTLSLTQAATPSADGTFVLTGTLNSTLGTCTQTLALAGTSSGVAVMLQTAATQTSTVPALSLLAFEDPTGATLDSSQFSYFPAPCTSALSSAQFTGKLAKQ